MKRLPKVLTGLCLGVCFAAMLLAGVSAQDQASVRKAEEKVAETVIVKRYEDGFLWSDGLEKVNYTIEVPQAGDYVLEMQYKALESKSDFIQLEGEISWDKDCDNFSVQLARPVEYGSIQTLKNKDQVRAETWISDKIQDKALRVYDHVTNEPCHWFLPEGEVTLSFEGVRTDFILYEVRMVPYTALKDYKEVKESETYKKAEPAQETILVQAENISCSSESSLGAQYDRSDALVSPSSARDKYLNIAGGENFNSDGQWLEWEFELPDSALYALRIKAKQNFNNGLSVNRRIYIDGEIPFKEAENVAVSYSNKWQLVTLHTSDNEEAFLYLEKGTHVLRMEVVPGPEAETILGMKGLVSDLTDIYRSIVMITGVNPDKNREYYLERDIPELLQKLQEAKEQLDDQKKLFEKLSGKKSGELATITTLSSQLESFLKEPDTIHKRLSSFKGNIEALSSFMLSISEQPLALDYILLAAPEEKAPKVNGNVWDNSWFEIKSLFYSFFPKQEEEKDVLTVWVSLGRDQMQVIKEMTDNRYTLETGQKVEFSLVQQGITEAILAGNSPDVVLFSDNQEIVNLAMRGALEPINECEGYEKLKDECQEQAFIPYEYKGQCYGVPFTQLFPMLFVRTDIFEELGLKVPETWDDVCAIIPAIQRKNMQVGIPSGDQTFATMLWQNGQGYYNSDHTATNFNNQTAVDVFSKYTRLFTDYDLPVTYDFFNRFRSGEMPIAIADYTEYNRLLMAAPEITGKWKMYCIPGTTQETVDYSVQSSLGQGGYVLSKSTHKQQAGEFLMWFAQAQQQAEYARKSEAILGAIGRYAPANQKAFEYMSWLPEEQEIIMKQWMKVKENPQMPGSYYTKRNLANAFRAVVYDGVNNREALLKYASEIDRELKRKAEEYR